MEGRIALSDEAVARLLVGLSVEISVGEPWDFDSPDGQSALKGRISAVDQDQPSPWKRYTCPYLLRWKGAFPVQASS